MKTSTARDIKSLRDQIAYQFLQEAIRLRMVVEENLGNHRYKICDQQTGKVHTAMVLPCSFDYYECRLNVIKKRKVQIDLLIVERHNAVVPIPVCSLRQVRIYEPLAVPHIDRENSKRRNHEESMLLLSKLILNFESAYEDLGKMNPRSSRRYLAMRSKYLKPKVGRPWAS